jgi:hypothetical protein
LILISNRDAFHAAGPVGGICTNGRASVPTMPQRVLDTNGAPLDLTDATASPPWPPAPPPPILAAVSTVAGSPVIDAPSLLSPRLDQLG